MFISAEPHPPDGGAAERSGGDLLADQRARIVDAMVAVVAERGYAQLAIRPVVARARVSSGTFYELFADREDCFLAAVDERGERLIDAVASGCAAEPDPRRRFRAGLEAFLALCAAEPDTARLCVVELQAAGPAGRERRAALMERLAALAEPALAAAGERAGGGELPPLTATIVLGGIHQLVQDRVVRGDAARLPELAPEIVRLVLPALA